MPHGLLLHLGLLAAAAAFAGLTTVSHQAALAAAGGLALCAGGLRRLEDLPKLGFLAILALVPLSYLGARIELGVLNSLTKLIFIPAFGLLVVDRVLSRRAFVPGRPYLFLSLFGLALLLAFVVNDRTPYSTWFLSRFFSMLLLVVLGANVLRSEADLKALLVVAVVSCLASAVGALATRPPLHANGTLGGLVRMTGWSVEDAPTFGTNLLVAMLICLYFAVVARRMVLRAALCAGCGVLALAIVQTYARGVSIVTVLSVALLLFRLRRRVCPLRLAALLLVLLLCLWPLVPDAYWERMTTMVTQHATDPTMNRRVDSYQIGLALFGQRPLFGYGPGNFIAQYMSPEFRYARTGVASVCFNLYLSIATQAGLVGLTAFGLLVWNAFRELRFVMRSFGEGDGFLRQTAELLEIVLVSLLLISMFEPTDLQKYLWIVLAAAAAVAHIRRSQLSTATGAAAA